jgi:hypothetical protein
MKLGVIATLAIGSAAAAIGFSPLAAAAPGGTTNSNNTSVQQHPGNTEITVQPGLSSLQAAQLQQPFGGTSNALIFHH